MMVVLCLPKNYIMVFSSTVQEILVLFLLSHCKILLLSKNTCDREFKRALSASNRNLIFLCSAFSVQQLCDCFNADGSVANYFCLGNAPNMDCRNKGRLDCLSVLHVSDIKKTNQAGRSARRLEVHFSCG